MSWDTSKSTKAIRELQAQVRLLRNTLINCNVQAASNADQCDDCEWVMQASGRGLHIAGFDMAVRRKKKARK